MKKLAIYTFVLILSIIFCSSVGFTQPSPMVTVWGYATYNGSPVPQETPVSVTVGQDNYETTIYDASGGYYQQFSQPANGTSISVSCTYQNAAADRDTTYQGFDIGDFDLVLANQSINGSRKVLMEFFTNTGNSPCASANQSLNECYLANYDNVTIIRYHTSWPSADDPFYQNNPTENTDRWNYYNPAWLPYMGIDGILDGGVDPNTWEELVNQRLAVTSPMKIQIDANFDWSTNQGESTIKVIATENFTYTDLRFFFGIVENEIFYTGSNGDPVHYQVMRDMVPDANGEQFTISSGDTVIFTRNFDITPVAELPNSGVPENTEIFVFVQDYASGSKEIFQSDHFAISDLSSSSPAELDSLALVDLYNSTDGDNWTNNENWLTAAPLEDWYGVDLWGGDRVKSLDLHQNNLIGTLPASLGNLTQIEWLTLYNNQLNGEIPTGIWQITGLLGLSVSGNQLNGTIPAAIGNLTNLQDLYLNGNNLSGTLPAEIGQLTNLQLFMLSSNQFSGELPSSIGNLTSLTNLSISYNQLTGELPLSIGNLINLTRLSISNNQLSGAIPSSIGSLTNLERIALWNNQLSGNIPAEFWNCTNLTHIWLGTNINLGGTLPSTINNLANLQVLWIDSTQISGTIPAEIAQLSNLVDLKISNNQLDTPIPAGLCTMPSLTTLWIEGNNFGETDCDAVQCLIDRGGWTELVHSPQNNGFDFTTDCNQQEISHALQFDGENNFLIDNDPIFPENDLTLEAWIKPGLIGGTQEILYWFGENVGVQFRMNDDGAILYGESVNGIWSYVVSPSNAVHEDFWAHLAVTKQADQCNLYINGEHAAYFQFDNDPMPTVMNIGGRSNNMDRFFNGEIDEVRLWNIARTQGEIQTNMQNYLQGTESGLIGYWKMNEGTGQTVVDLTSNNNTLQLGEISDPDGSDPGWIANDWPYEIIQYDIVGPLMTTDWMTYTWPYNAYYPEDAEGINGHLGNACGPTGMAHMMKYWNNPIIGRDSLSFTDNNGHYWSANFGETNYDWVNMSNYLPNDATEEEYGAVATLMYHTAVAMDDYWGSGQSLGHLSDAMKNYFRYSDSAQVLYREDFTPTQWDSIFRHELDNGRPIMIEGWTPESPAPGEPGNHEGHYFICDGYNVNGEYHIKWNYNNNGKAEGYYPLYEFEPYSGYNWALVGFQPMQVSEADSLALVDLYNSTNGANWTNNTNWLTSNPIDTWHGVTIDGDGRLSRLNLWNNNLTGTLSTSIGNWTNLDILELNSNQLTGDIPATIGQLTELDTLSLSYNQLDGALPAEIGNLTGLKRFSISNNQLIGSIPTTIGNMTNLEQIALWNNQLSGDIPSELWNCTHLTHIWLGTNINLSGTLPSTINNLTNLQVLWIDGTQLSGTIPAEIAQLTNLIDLKIRNNQLDTPVPAGLCTMPSLTTLWIEGNNFEQTDCDGVQCLIDRGGWIEFTHSPQNDGFDFTTDCNQQEISHALQFDGVDDFAQIGNPELYLLNQFTLEAWVNPAQHVQYGGIMTLGSVDDEAWSLHFGDSGNINYWQTSDSGFSSVSTSQVLGLDQWYHVALSHDGSTVTIYINGQLAATDTIPSPTQLSENYNLYLGNQISVEPEYLNGKLDEARIWNYARSQREIQSMMDSYLRGSESGLVGYWQMNDGREQSITDLSINSNNGQLGSTTDIDDNDPAWLITEWPYAFTIPDTSYALQFDGNDQVQVNLDAPQSDFTLEAWVKCTADSWDGYNTIVEFGDDSPYFGVQFDGQLILYSQFKGGTVPLNEWAHVACVVNGIDVKLYINGELVVSENGNPTYWGTQMGIGGHIGDSPWIGMIDEVRYWNVERTQNQIQGAMTTYLNGSENGLVGYWRMNDGTGQIVADLSGNGNTGQLGTTLGSDDYDPVWGATDWPYDAGTVNLPHITVSPDSFDVSLQEGESATEQLIITNTGNADLTFSLSDSASWLTYDIVSGTLSTGEDTTIILTFDATTLSAGDYSANLTIDHNDPDKTNSLLIPCNLTVTSSGEIVESKILPDDGDEGFREQFGYSTAISGDYAIVGAWWGDENGVENSGSAYIFHWNGVDWVQQAELTADDAAAGDQFGCSVAISGNYAIIGACFDDDIQEGTGSAYIFHRDGITWTHQAKLVGEGNFRDWFGTSVSISGDYAVVGAIGDDDNGLDAGATYIFHRDGTAWAQQAKVTAADGVAEDKFGTSVSISGDYIIAGIDHYWSGRAHAYVFHRDGTAWTQQAQLSPSDGNNNFFGTSVSIDGDYAIIGARGDSNINGNGAGAAYIFNRVGTTWTEQSKLLASTSGSNTAFGYSVNISGNKVVIGTPDDGDLGDDCGSAYIFERTGTTWVEDVKLLASDATSYVHFGTSVGISGNNAIIGTPYTSDFGDESGSAYIFDLGGVAPTPKPQIYINPVAFDMMIAQGETDSASLTIENMGTANLTFALFDSISWLSYDIVSGLISAGEDTTITLTFDATALGIGVYSAMLKINHNDSTETNPLPISCDLTVTPPDTGSYALQFDGEDDFIVTPLNIDQNDTSDGVTMEAWVYPVSTAYGRHYVVCSDDGGFDWSILQDRDDWYVFTGSSSYNTGFTIDLNKWQHIAAVFVPGEGVRFYKNGHESLISNISYDDSNSDIYIGKHGSYNGYEFEGNIDEVRIWDGIRTQEEIEINMESELTGDETGLLAYWNLDDGSGQTIFDLTDNGNDGQLGENPDVDTADPVWLEADYPHHPYVDPANGDWLDQYAVLYDTDEAQMVVRVGDIDNLGFGWAAGFDPFSGQSTSSHNFPWDVDSTDTEGTDRIMVVSSYNGFPPDGRDGYTTSTNRPENLPRPIVMHFERNGIPINAANLQIFVDDFQAPRWAANYQVTINDVRAPFLENIINSLDQHGPIGKMISVQVPNDFLYLLENDSLGLFFDDPTTGAGDGHAIDFVKLLINPVGFTYTGTITGNVTADGESLPGATVVASNIVSATTDSTGGYTLENVPAGLVYVKAYKAGFDTVASFVDLEADETIENIDFELTEQVITAFVADTTLGEAPLTVNFTDQSLGNPTAWLWYFGDGDSSTVQNPTHIYENEGSYSVTLQAFRDALGDTLTKIDYITVESDSGCTIPDWQTPEGFSESMTVTCRVFLDGIPEQDTENLVGAFVGEEVRGVNDGPFYNIGGIYMALITIASNTVGEEISFKLFDASSCEIMEIDETLTFSNDGYGGFDDPVEFHVKNSITQTIPLIENWNWISFNVEAEDMSVNNVLASIGGNGVKIKTNNTSAQYYAGMGWLPNITIDPKKLYKLKMDIADTLELEGQAIVPETTPIGLIENWNWIAYYPQTEMDVNMALASLPEGSAVKIKTNNTSAQYYASMGWLPPINMIPNKGYVLNMNQAETLTYPSNPPARSDSKTTGQASRTEMPEWYVPEGFEESMSIACYVTINQVPEMDAENMIGAFVDGEIRGVSNGGFFPVNGNYVAIVTVAGNIGEEVTFDLYDTSTEEILITNNMVTFQNDGYGTLENPYELAILSTGIGYSDLDIPTQTALRSNFPNPFNPTTTIQFDLAQAGNVSLKIYDTMGRLVKNLVDEVKKSGYYSVIWDGTDEKGKPVQSGLYIYRLEADEVNQVKRMLMLK